MMQSELQNKVRQLLESQLPIAEDVSLDDGFSISFEKGRYQLMVMSNMAVVDALMIGWCLGGVSLGTLIKQNGDEEPIYFDGGEDSDPLNWCRQCRSRSRSLSLSKGKLVCDSDTVE